MTHCVLLALLLALVSVHVHSAPVEQVALEQGSCEDASAIGAAGLALTKINQDRQEGYIFSLHRLSNVHMTKHGETGLVFYLTLDVVETNCSVLSKKDWKTCEPRPTDDTPVYGQCKAAIYINKVHRVVRLYKYNCAVRPVPAVKVNEICPDCPSLIALDDAEIQKTVSLSLEKFNKESNLRNRFALLKVTRATSGMAMSMYYNAEYTIQETTCRNGAEVVTADKCPAMDCEFAHKGFCKASHFHSPTSEISVECEIYEPENAEREKKLHLLGGETEHSHTNTETHKHDHDHAHDHAHAADPAHAHDHHHDHAHAAGSTHSHDHVHDHTKSHSHHGKAQKHTDNGDHHHTHDHDAGSGHKHAHGHSHDHGHGHDHVHAHHAQAHNHSDDLPNQHHDYKHTNGMHTHEHDHELALDHDHKHVHLHEHEHHHHHHEHEHETTAHDHPEGMVRVLPAMDQPMTLPSFPDVPAAGPEVGVTLPLKPDPQIPGQMEPTIEAFPTTVSAQCAPPAAGSTLVEKLFTEDPMFKPAA